VEQQVFQIQSGAMSSSVFENIRKLLTFERTASSNTLNKGHKYKKITKSTAVKTVAVRKIRRYCIGTNALKVPISSRTEIIESFCLTSLFLVIMTHPRLNM
jgi:hypothetical protein